MQEGLKMLMSKFAVLYLRAIPENVLQALPASYSHSVRMLLLRCSTAAAETQKPIFLFVFFLNWRLKNSFVSWLMQICGVQQEISNSGKKTDGIGFFFI